MAIKEHGVSVERRGFPEKYLTGLEVRSRCEDFNPEFLSLIPALAKNVPAPFPLMVLPLGELGPGVKPMGTFGVTHFQKRNPLYLRIAPGDMGAQLGDLPLELSAKGGGFIQEGRPVLWQRNNASDDSGVWGLLDYEEARKEFDMAMRLKALGADVSVPVAIYLLDELPELENGRIVMKSIDALKASGRLPKNFRPAVLIRAANSNMRIQDLTRSPKRNKSELLGGMKLAARDIQGEVTPRLYLEWLARKIARTMAIVHRNNLVHLNTHAGNFSIAGELWDFDTIEERDGSDPSRRAGMNYDVEATGTGFGVWYGALNQLERVREIAEKAFREPIISKNELRNIFISTYKEHFPSQELFKD